MDKCDYGRRVHIHRTGLLVISGYYVLLQKWKKYLRYMRRTEYMNT